MTYKHKLDAIRDKYGDESLKLFREREALRMKEFRLRMTQEQKETYREKAKIRQRKYVERQRKKMKPTTRSSANEHAELIEQKRKYWREKQREARQRRKERIQNEKSQKNTESENGNSEWESCNDNDSSVSIGPTVFESHNAKRQALHRVKKSLPSGNSKKWAEIMTNIIHTASPTKKRGLEEKGISTFAPDDLEHNRKIMERIAKMNDDTKKKRDKTSIIKQRVLAELILGSEDSSSDEEMVRSSDRDSCPASTSHGRPLVSEGSVTFEYMKPLLSYAV